jgi:hypothetical protein
MSNITGVADGHDRPKILVAARRSVIIGALGAAVLLGRALPVEAVPLPQHPCTSGNAAVASAVAGLSIFIPAMGWVPLSCAIAGRVKNTRIAVSKSFFMAFPFRWFNVYIYV